jgi:two-component system sensor histidine kinase CpxA
MLPYTPFLVSGGLVAFISVAFWIPFVRGLTQTISRMEAATAQIAEGRFNTQLPSKRLDELGDLAESISRMGHRLDLLVNGQKRFLRDAAHELRSPIARLQVALGLLERSSTNEQRKTIADLDEDVQQMSTLIGDLLNFSKSGMQASHPEIGNVEVEPIARRAIRLEGKETQVSFVGDARLKVRADGEMLLRALSNLVRNSVRYAGSYGAIEIDARHEGESVTISVRDSGPGIPESDVDAVFEPFYRLESARERNSGGVGLGLAIVKSDIEACGGSVRCRNRQPHGLEVEIRLPQATPGN